MSKKPRRRGPPPKEAKFSPDGKYAELGTRAWTLHPTTGWKSHSIRPMKHNPHPVSRLVRGMAGLKGIVYSVDKPVSDNPAN